MALNQVEIQKLENAGLDGLFTKNKKLWTRLAREAYSYTAKYIDEDEDVRVDDVILVLEPALSVTPTLQDYLSEHRLNQKYWNRWFGDFILDQLWDDLGGG